MVAGLHSQSECSRSPRPLPRRRLATTPVTGALVASQSGTTSFRVDAHSGPSGENPTGTASWHLGGGLGPTWSVGITCVSVSGNAGVVGLSGTLSQFEGLQIPVAGLLRVVDAGGPASRQDSFEWAETQGLLGGAPIPGPTDCSSYPSTFRPFGTVSSMKAVTLVVVDAPPPPPTTKDQCKDEGWRNYIGFKNQGQCVSFVATGGKNQTVG